METSLKRKVPLGTEWYHAFEKEAGARLIDKTGTAEPSGQLRALVRLRDKVEAEYRARLCARAYDHFSEFVEYMDLTEPPARHHEFICEKLEAIERREILRATFSMPPGHAKTKFCSRYFPAWYLGRNPDHRYLQGGHAQDFVETEYGQYVRDLIASPDYRDVFPEVELDPASRAAGRWRIAGKRASSYVAKGVGQGISGFRAHIGGIDDMFGKREDARSPTIRDKAKKYLFSDFRPRLLPRSPWFLVGTRWHMDDGIGQAIALNKDKKGIPWEVFVLDAIIETEREMEEDPLGRSIGEVLWPEFYTFEELMEIKATLVAQSGISDWWALYKNRPREEEGNVVKSKWFRRYKELPHDTRTAAGTLERNVRRVTISVDCAMKATARSKYTAAGVWIEDTGGRHYKAHVERKRVEYVDMCELINNTAREWIDRYPYASAAILVEDAGNGTAYISQWAGKAPAPVIAVPKPSSDDKSFRFDSVTPMFEGGEVYLPEQAPWLEAYEEEVLAFPNGSYSDQVDETSQYLSWARRKRPNRKTRVVGSRLVS